MQHPSRIVLAAAAIASLGACSGAPAARVGTEPRMIAAPQELPAESGVREQTADEQVNHVLNRLTFGARPGDALAVRAMGVDQWIDAQLHPERIDDSKSDQYFAGLESYNKTAQALQEEYPPPNQLLRRLQAKGDRSKLTPAESAELRDATEGVRKVTAEAESGRINRALLSERQLQEVMTDFWLNHFSVYIQKGPPERYQLAQYESKVIRPNSLGKFRTLLEAVAKSPAMLFYLDNWESQADSNRPRLEPIRAGRAGSLRNARGGLLTPQQQQQAARRRGGLNENYGRELLELHTLGVDGGYTQQDVINVARAFTGWTFPRPQQGGGAFEFNPQMHDAGEKIVLGHKLASGRGIQDGEDVLDIVARNPRRRASLHAQARASIRERHAARRPRRARRRDVPANRRRHPGSRAHDRHEPGVLLPRGVSQQSEVTVRGGGERPPRARRAAGRNAADRPDRGDAR